MPRGTSIYFGDAELEWLDKLVEAKVFKNRSAAVCFCIQDVKRRKTKEWLK